MSALATQHSEHSAITAHFPSEYILALRAWRTHHDDTKS